MLCKSVGSAHRSIPYEPTSSLPAKQTLPATGSCLTTAGTSYSPILQHVSPISNILFTLVKHAK